jgi:transcription initiation factor TFIID subunit 6
LSREQQLLFKQITEALLGDAQELRSSALESLAQDPGQHQLVPFFIEFATDKVTHNLKDINVLSGVAALIGALYQNPNVILELYVSGSGFSRCDLHCKGSVT